MYVPASLICLPADDDYDPREPKALEPNFRIHLAKRVETKMEERENCHVRGLFSGTSSRASTSTACEKNDQVDMYTLYTHIIYIHTRAYVCVTPSVHCTRS